MLLFIVSYLLHIFSYLSHISLSIISKLLYIKCLIILVSEVFMGLFLLYFCWILLTISSFLIYLVIFNYMLDIVEIICGFGRSNSLQRAFVFALPGTWGHYHFSTTLNQVKDLALWSIQMRKTLTVNLCKR